MPYLVNEIFYTLQGEGFWSGRPAVFCRFARCNLWTGREEDRHWAVCKFCDTDFLHGEKLSLDELIGRVCTAWPTGFGGDHAMIVLTGGEPTLQIDGPLIDALHDCGFYIAVETNGTRPVHQDINWICVSPKANTRVLQSRGHELKLVYPQDGLNPQKFESLPFQHFWLSPMNNPYGELDTTNTKAAIQFCLDHPRWRLNIQMHKVIGVP